jgi:hypothetical protein
MKILVQFIVSNETIANQFYGSTHYFLFRFFSYWKYFFLRQERKKTSSMTFIFSHFKALYYQNHAFLLEKVAKIKNNVYFCRYEYILGSL